ncbi:CG5157 [Drosophila busckii]|uniref:CG5157 n=1 Tax=Drosophila busckii TaxID=30019 RepID=A0A0M4EH92_DROBS|nr:cytochrome b5 [Drosophila busckii]ALC43927.1 CG5157 [Drosophila busckii]
MSQIYQLAEVALRNGKQGQPSWLIIKGSVYDVSGFLAEHPGGADLLLEYAGKDASKAFQGAGHSAAAVRDLKQYKIGEVAITTQPESVSKQTLATESPKQTLDKSQKSFLCCC